MSLLDESVLNFRVLPNDIDVSKITNDRFIALMDLGRMDVAFRIGLLKIMVRRKWVPLATFNTIRFRYSLSIFQKYQLHTKIIFWDEKTFYFEQKFVRQNRILATGYICATCLGPDGPITPKQIISALGQSVSRPKKPLIVKKLCELENNIHQEQKNMNNQT